MQEIRETSTGTIGISFEAAPLALELGHTNQTLIFNHYRELVKPEQAEKWWNIRPAAQTKLVALSA